MEILSEIAPTCSPKFICCYVAVQFSISPTNKVIFSFNEHLSTRAVVLNWGNFVPLAIDNI